MTASYVEIVEYVDSLDNSNAVDSLCETDLSATVHQTESEAFDLFETNVDLSSACPDEKSVKELSDSFAVERYSSIDNYSYQHPGQNLEQHSNRC